MSKRELYETSDLSSLPVRNYRELLLKVVTLKWAWEWASIEILPQFFYVVGKALSGELSCMQTGLVNQVSNSRHLVILLL